MINKNICTWSFIFNIRVISCHVWFWANYSKSIFHFLLYNPFYVVFKVLVTCGLFYEKNSYLFWCATMNLISLPKPPDPTFNMANYFFFIFESRLPAEGSIGKNPETVWLHIWCRCRWHNVYESRQGCKMRLVGTNNEFQSPRLDRNRLLKWDQGRNCCVFFLSQTNIEWSHESSYVTSAQDQVRSSKVSAMLWFEGNLQFALTLKLIIVAVYNCRSNRQKIWELGCLIRYLISQFTHSDC